MEKDIIVNMAPTKAERETLYHICDGEKMVECDSTIPRDYNKCVRRGWEITQRYVTKDGKTVGMRLKAPLKALSVRSAEPQTRNVSAETLAKLAAGRAKRL